MKELYDHNDCTMERTWLIFDKKSGRHKKSGRNQVIQYLIDVRESGRRKKSGRNQVIQYLVDVRNLVEIK